MKLPSALIIVGGHRNNIDIIIAEQSSKTDFRLLINTVFTKDILSKNRSKFDPTSIPKTFIYSESVSELHRIAFNLRHVMKKLLPAEERHKAREFVRIYHAGLSHEIKEETERWIFEGGIRIVLCMDAMSLGVDFPDILRVIQWDIDGKLTLSILFQRIGRAARDPDYYGVAVIFTPKMLLKCISEAAECRFDREHDASDSYAFPPFDLDQRDIDLLRNDHFRDLSKFTLAIENNEESYKAV